MTDGYSVIPRYITKLSTLLKKISSVLVRMKPFSARSIAAAKLD